VPGGSSALPEIFAYADETCRAVAEEMATSGLMNMPVVDRATGRICGSITALELLAGRKRSMMRESERSSFYGRA
jgi:chloride channel protein, CIC family